MVTMKKQVIIILLSVWATTSFAQRSLLGEMGISSSSNQQLIEEAVKSSFIMLHTTYQLEDNDTKERYNIEGNDYFFGERYSIAIRTPEGYIANDAALRPWEHDNNFEQYREQYKPVILRSEYKLFDDTNYTDQTETFKPEEMNPILENKLYAATDGKFDNKGLITKTLDDTNDGWIVWVTIDKSAKKENAKLHLVIYRLELNGEKDKLVYDIANPKIDKEKIALGGMYIFPEITDIGIISFRLLGALQEQGEKWQLIPTAHDKTEFVAPQTGKKPSKNDGKLKKAQ
jgi:hypothetical protein